MLSPDKKYPLDQLNHQVIFLKNFITNPNISVGDYTYYASSHAPEDFEKENVIFGLTSKLTIGKFCQIAEGTKFLLSDANHQMSGFSTYPFFIFGRYNQECSSWQDYELLLSDKGDTCIGNDVWFGHQSLVMPGVCIGDGAIIGARSVVTKDVPPYCIAVGNPAKVVKKRFNQEVVEKLLELRWWNWDFHRISRHLPALMSGSLDQLIDA